MVRQSLNSQCRSPSKKHLERWRPIICLEKFHKLYKKLCKCMRLNYRNPVLYEILTLYDLDLTHENLFLFSHLKFS